MDEANKYDVTIIGGGLAGLALSIQLSRLQYRVALFEKEQYPFHKVCGEYLSMESWDFIESLGLPLSQMNLPIIKKLIVTSPDGTALEAPLPLGGFGISRYLLDNELKKIAIENKVSVFENCKVDEVNYNDDQFQMQTGKGIFNSKICCGTFGKRSKLDIKWKRDFISKKNNKLSNYIGVKYHIKTSMDADTIALHNFSNGYCGVSKIEGDEYCLCYLTLAANLSSNNNSIPLMERRVLHRNKYLKYLFENSEMIFSSPVTISQISFKQKSQVHNHVLLLGDAAGVITPLCGNGMSMALHSSKIAAACVHDFLQNKTFRKQLEEKYTQQWKNEFSLRLKAGRFIQHFFGKESTTNLFVRIMKAMPFVTKKLIELTHGKPF